jgi:hypothetical protein
MRFVLLSLVVLGAGGCAKHAVDAGKHAVDAVEEMRARACAGDATGFFSHVDRNEMTRMSVAAATKQSQATFARLDPIARAAMWERMHELVLTGIDDAFRQWDFDVKRGSAGDLCHMTIIESSESGDTADVRVKNPTDARWKMARHGDRWFLVGSGT